MLGNWRENASVRLRSGRNDFTIRSADLQISQLERVFLFKPAEKAGEAHKFARPYHGPFWVIELGTNTAKVRRVDKPKGEPILVSLDQLRQCPEEISDKFWPHDKVKKTKKKNKERSKEEALTATSDKNPSPQLETKVLPRVDC